MRWLVALIILIAGAPAVAAQLLFAGGQWVALDRGGVCEATSRSLRIALKGRVQADLPATARVITGTEERERFLRPIARLWRIDHPLMVRSAPLVEITFD